MLPTMISDLVITNTMCPTQWAGTTQDKREFIAHYRNGRLRIWVASEIVYDKQVARKDSHRLDTDKMMKLGNFEGEWTALVQEKMRRLRLSEKQARKFGITLDRKTAVRR